jgi:hypothetical protein
MSKLFSAATVLIQYGSQEQARQRQALEFREGWLIVFSLLRGTPKMKAS